jgi:predicted esterase
MLTALRVLLVGSVVGDCGTSTTDEPSVVDEATSPSSSSSTSSSSGSGGDPGGGSSSGSSGGSSSGAAPNDAGPDAPIVTAGASCASAVPAGVARPLALPVYSGICPTLAPAPATTKIGDREYIVFRPATVAAGEKLPEIFLWHWLGGAADKMGAVLDVQAAAEKHRFVGVVPASKGDTLFRWPMEGSQAQSRVDEEAKFFDDMLACVSAALPVNADCVSTAGVSAGALWSAQLAVARSERIASFVSLSGGVGGIVRDWSTVPHRMPALVLWGGGDDVYPEKFTLVDFEDASRDLEGALGKDGHFMVECIHNCGHSVPPFDPPPPGALRFDMMWRFLLDHPYWLPAGQSPYASGSLPPSFPAWCAKGAGKATMRAPGSACE